MLEPFHNLWHPHRAVRPVVRDAEFEKLGRELQDNIHAVFGRSLAIREVDSGSDNATEIEMNNLASPYYDVERFGVSFVASPKHADVMAITGAVTRNMELAVQKTWSVMPAPKPAMRSVRAS